MSDAAQGIPWGTQWDLVSAADESVDWSAFLVTLGFQDERAGGKAPVNRYFGTCAAGARWGTGARAIRDDDDGRPPGGDVR